MMYVIIQYKWWDYLLHENGKLQNICTLKLCITQHLKIMENVKT